MILSHERGQMGQREQMISRNTLRTYAHIRTRGKL